MEQDNKPNSESPLETTDWRLLQNNECVEQIDLLIRTVHLVRAALNNTFAQLDINEVRYSALKVIVAVNETGCSQSELARKLGQSESNICTLIERMEGDQLVIREQSQKDRRKRVLQVTDQGLRLLEQVKTCHGTVSHRLLTSLNSDQRRQLTGILQALLKSAYTQRSQRETVKTFQDVSSPYPLQGFPAA
ncbi:MAG: MarR family transcriptional regulator [Planctomycetes bacterium]|nr:MarR family transcriptional regulator [Planctomycetota bacterium]MCH9725276.1 MarR family transcriptional regulator [Planctomycetota bacterium]MCH9779504.1 MarR family transcriptional regulator [Planctomycetota bacterium]MCH9792641.1 MarR family transcriptional regulator [Planctomycetota bacterium]